MRARRGSEGFERLALCALWLMALASPAMAADARTTFIADNRCQITLRLDMIHARKGEPNRYLVVADRSEPRSYIQCLLEEDDTQMLCEASSGFYSVKPGIEPPGLSWHGLAVIEAAGFSTDDSEGNFQKLLAISNPDRDFHDVAGLLLGLLYDAYGVRRGEKLEYKAPLAKSPRGHGLVCPAQLSGFRAEIGERA
ncbi:hypothetical protein ABLE91_02830 [Aquabacter sp. CN5-332]|uniref:hypothetical protein n=1 Tax=Aquabacter sp. CN5-332 TaxID=3156608 RepID=UPI0032B479A6